MVRFECPISLSQYLSGVVGQPVTVKEDTFSELDRVFSEYGVNTEDNPLWDYPLGEIDEIVRNNINVCLVKVDTVKAGIKKPVYRWFEIPEKFRTDLISKDLL